MNLTSAPAFPPHAPSDPDAPHVTTATVEIDASTEVGPLTRLWESVGYDETARLQLDLPLPSASLLEVEAVSAA